MNEKKKIEEKEEKKYKKEEKKIRMQRRVGVKKMWMKVWKNHILWHLPRKKKIGIWQDFQIFSGNWK